MIEESGLVVGCRGDWAEIETLRRTSCGACAARAGCGVSLLDRFLGRRATRIVARNRIAAEVGQRVMVGIPEATLVTAALAAYLVPVLALIVGGLLVQGLADQLGWPETDLAGIGGSVLGLGASLAWLARYSRARRGDARYQAVVLRIEAGPGVLVALPDALSLTGFSGPKRA